MSEYLPDSNFHLSKPIICINSRSVINFIRGFGVSRKSYHTNKGNSALDEAEKKLREEAKNSKEQEDRVLEKFGVKTLSELQAKIDNVSNAYAPFKSVAIRNAMKDFNEKYDDSISDKALAGWIIKSIENDEKVQEQLTQATTDEAIGIISQFLADKVGEVRKESGSTKQVKQFYLKTHAENLLNFMNKESKSIKFTRNYKKDLVLKFVPEGESKGSSSWETHIDLNQLPTYGKLEFYPYFKLSAEEKEMAKSDTVTWENFKKNLSAIVENPYSQDISYVLDKYFSITDFYVDDINGVVGILGEVQALAILSSLIIQETNVQATGNKLNQMEGYLKGKKLGADFLLDNIYGIQVKNYKGYLTDEGKQGYHVHGDFNAQTIIERLTNETVKYDLGSYLAIVQYNQPYTNEENSLYDKSKIDVYRSYYNSLVKKSTAVHSTIKSLIAADINEFFPFSQWYKFIEEDEKQLYTNVFWFFGGEKLVASSQILYLLANRIKQLKEKLSGKGTAELNNFFTSYHYNNSLTWHPIGTETDSDGKDYLVGPETDSAETVLKDINITLDLNIFLDDIINFGRENIQT